MKSLKFLLLFAVCFAFVSCGHYKDGTSVWRGGAWIGPALLFLGAAIAGYFGYRSWTSGSITGGSSSQPNITSSDERIPFYKVWQWIFAAVFFIAAIVFIIVQNGEK